VWPAINLDFRAGGCPFTVPRVLEKKRQPTTKQRKEENEAQDVSRTTEHPLDASRFVPICIDMTFLTYELAVPLKVLLIKMYFTYCHLQDYDAWL